MFSPDSRFGVRRLWPRTADIHDPRLDRLDRACFVLLHNGQAVGHLSTVLSAFRTPFRPFTRQDWLWGLVVWGDGRRDMPFEDYPPWSWAEELLSGRFEYDGTAYAAAQVSDDERDRIWKELAITDADF